MTAASPLTVRRATTQDAAGYARMMADPAVYAGLMQLPYPSEELWQARLTEMLAPGKPDLHLVAERDGELVGGLGLHAANPSPRRRHAMVLGLSVVPAAQRQGVGSALLQAACDYADRWVQVLRLELDVYVDNTPAIALYRRFGFEVEGTHRAYALRDGVYVDSYAMARLHPNPPQLPPRGGPA
ncbi:MAG TPA: GNAT family N-acetyltransferase [Methylibium sp.]|nr:GNAT family N-acetyltransferase [Methylibium sp.]